MIEHTIYPYWAGGCWHFECELCTFVATYGSYGYRVIDAGCGAVHKTATHGDRTHPRRETLSGCLPDVIIAKIREILERCGW